MRLPMTLLVFGLLVACDKGGDETAAEAPAHPLLVAKCKAGTTSACDELAAKCEAGEQTACDEKAKLKKTKTRPMNAPAPSASAE